VQKRIKLGSKTIAKGQPCFIIAEAGINHNGKVGLAKKLVDIAAAAGADAVKFQKRDINSVFIKEVLNRSYSGPHSFGKTYRGHKKALEFSDRDFRKIKKYCDKKKILFLASGWDRKSVDFLESLDVAAFKIASADLTNTALLRHTARKKKPIILSTGMATMKEVIRGVGTVRKINERLVVLHCTSTYPCKTQEVNLNIIRTYKRKFGPLVGYSGHELGIATTLCAVVMGAVMVARFTRSCNCCLA